MEARVNAFRRQRTHLIVMECTFTDDSGRIAEEYDAGTQSYIEARCPHCDQYVFMDRENLHGWQECQSDVEADASAYFACPTCGARWSDRDRDNAMMQGRCVDAKDSLTWSFRWNGANNLFLSSGDLGVAEWKAKYQSSDQQSAERELCQFYWGRPYKPIAQHGELVAADIKTDPDRIERAEVPAWADFLVAGCDVGRWEVHWSLMAWTVTGRSHLVDYGISECPTDDVGEERGIEIALNKIDDRLNAGYAKRGESTPMIPAIRCIDTRYLPDTVIRFCRSHRGWWPCQGFGVSQQRFGAVSAGKYTTPSKSGQNVLQIGEEYHVLRDSRGRDVVQHNVDWGKLYVHRALQAPTDDPRAMTLFSVSSENEHYKFIRHVTAERLQLVEGSYKWVQERKQNHYLDSTVLAMLAARIKGVLPGIVAASKQEQNQSLPAAAKSRPNVQQHSARKSTTIRRFRRAPGARAR
jgi:phage terminase large subunit GpA-like protein